MTKYFFLLLIAVVGFGANASAAHAETEFMTSWQTRTYVPTWYEGKAFPTYESAIIVSFELIEDGKVVDLSKHAVRWYVDGKLIKNEINGMGIKRITIVNKKYGGDVVDIKITIPSYNNTVFEKSFDIPIKLAEVVIDVPYFQKKLPKGENPIYAWPFFFNTTSESNLNLQWGVNGNNLPAQNAADPLLLFTVGNDIASGVRSTIEATIINQRKGMENIKKRVFVEAL